MPLLFENKWVFPDSRVPAKPQMAEKDMTPFGDEVACNSGISIGYMGKIKCCYWMKLESFLYAGLYVV